MSELEDLVSDIVCDFCNDEKLFTALDVSNEVKLSMPTAKHREVREIVRQQFHDMIGYGRTPISVSLEDGSQAMALLYHPLSDSWDLDDKYDSQKRAQTSMKASNNCGLCSIVAPPVQDPTSVVPVAPPPPPSPRTLWDRLFSVGNLFPNK